MPFSERTAARSLLAVPRGSSIPLPSGRVVRLFLHWAQPDRIRVDLDLSVSFYDAAWEFLGACDYTNLRFLEHKAIHSGDFTSAPRPDGASEFVDLDIARLFASDVRYAVMVVFAYNIPFERLRRGFAGLMGRDEPEAAVFDARTVKQRIDLQGRSRVCAPMAIDFHERRVLWMDVNGRYRGRARSRKVGVLEAVGGV